MKTNTETGLKILLERIKESKSGATLENYKNAHYEFGFQYSITENGETTVTDSTEKAIEMIKSLKGSCGVWYYNRNYYIETSYYTNSIIKAGLEAWKHNQLSIYDWKRNAYIQVRS